MIKAIVYTSNTGLTEQYAKILSDRIGLPAYKLDSSAKQLEKGTKVIYLGWLCATNVKGYRHAAKKYDVAAVCGVGLCDTGCLLDEVRKAARIPDGTPLFTVQGGIQKAKLRGMNSFMIKMLIKVFKAKKDRSADDERMLKLLLNDANYVSENNLTDLLQWYEAAYDNSVQRAEK